MNVKLLLKRGALLAAANWPVVAIQLVARLTFQALLAVPVVSAAALVTIVLGSEPRTLLQGSLRDTLAAVANALRSEPAALLGFLATLGLVLVGGSILLFVVKGGTVSVLLWSEEHAGRIERDPLHLEPFRQAGAFTFGRFTSGCRRLFRRYVLLGLTLMAIYGLSAAAYLGLVWQGYQAVGSQMLYSSWTLVLAAGAIVLVAWIIAINLLHLLLQIVIAVEDIRLGAAWTHAIRFIRAEPRRVGGVFLVIFGLLAAATLASALAWSAIALVAFVPIVGIIVIPLQITGVVLRGLLFEYIGLTGLSAYLALYREHAYGVAASEGRDPARGWNPTIVEPLATSRVTTTRS